MYDYCGIKMVKSWGLNNQVDAHHLLCMPYWCKCITVVFNSLLYHMGKTYYKLALLNNTKLVYIHVK